VGQFRSVSGRYPTMQQRHRRYVIAVTKTHFQVISPDRGHDYTAYRF